MPSAIEGESSGDNLLVSHVSFAQSWGNTDGSDTSSAWDAQTASGSRTLQQAAADVLHVKRFLATPMMPCRQS